ncbi:MULTISPECIES: hypothetical protein [unclassified Microcoleus]|nr:MULTISPECIES: hypothetical protein [unclassified Microcoleus]
MKEEGSSATSNVRDVMDVMKNWMPETGFLRKYLVWLADSIKN